MSDEELTRLEQIANAATPGPWKAVYWDDEKTAFENFDQIDTPIGATSGGVVTESAKYAESFSIADERKILYPQRITEHTHTTEDGEVHEEFEDRTPPAESVGLRVADATFIALARQAVPALIAEVRRLRKQLGAT